MSKRINTKIPTWEIVIIAIMLFAAAHCLAAETELSKKFGRENPFEVVKPAKVAAEPIIKEVIVEVIKETGITQAQLQEAIQAALKAAPRQIAPQPVVIEAEPIEIIIPEKHIKSIMLKFLRAENFLTIVNAMLTTGGTASVDKDTNTLIICDTQESLEKILAQIAKADRTPQQILVEVVIIDVQLSDNKELGVNWDNLFQISGGLGSVSYAQNLNNLTTGGTLTLINGRIQNTIKALQTQRDTEILACPKVLVLSGQEAYFETVEEISYTDLTQTGAGGGVDGNPIASTKFKNAGITLTVKATIMDDGRIMIDVEPDQSINTGVTEVGGSSVPTIDRRKIKTTLLMSEGEIAVIGGMRSKDVRLSTDKIPLLGDIPYIGGLFSSSKKVVQNSELLILISPHIHSANHCLIPEKKAIWDEAKSLGGLSEYIDETQPEHVDVASLEEELASSLAILKKRRKK